MVVGDGAECISCSAPLLGHLVHVRRPPIALQRLVLLARTSLIRECEFWDVLETLLLKQKSLSIGWGDYGLVCMVSFNEHTRSFAIVTKPTAHLIQIASPYSVMIWVAKALG